MRKIYLAVFLVFAVSVFLFIISFVYFDKHNHKILYYTLSIDDQYFGTEKIDKFVTEEERIYKSASNMPFRELFTEARTRLETDLRYNLRTYQKELFANGEAYLFYAENKNDSVSFLSRYISRFNYFDGMPIRRKTFIFEEESPITYLPILENYDFKKGGAQSFNSIIYSSDKEILPAKGFVTLTSIKNEYLKIGRSKIKSENLLLKIKGCPPGIVWVAKSDKSLLRIEIPSIGMKITRNFKHKEQIPKETPVPVPSGDCISREVTFYNKSRQQLSGTITTPREDIASPSGDGRYPAVLLAWGEGPQNRDYQGLFKSIAEYLPKYGYCVLRFDKRGIGSSAGDASSITPDGELEDLSSAADFLSLQKDVNPKRISVISHGRGALNALRLAQEHPDIKSIILMAPILEPRNSEAALRDRATRQKWNDEYLMMAISAVKQTEGKAQNPKRNWGYILGKKCYLKSVREEGAIKPDEVMEKNSTAILILQGKKDLEVSADYAHHLDRALSASGKVKHSIIYFDYAGYFLGKLFADGVSKMHYEADKEILASIRDWLNLNTVELPKEPDNPLSAQ